MYRGWFHVLLFSLFVSVGRVLDFSSKLVGIASKHLLMCFVFLIRDIGIFSNNSWVERFFYDDVRVWNNKFSEALKIISFINSSRVISNLIRSVANGKFPSNSRLIFLKKLLRKVGVIAHLAHTLSQVWKIYRWPFCGNCYPRFANRESVFTSCRMNHVKQRFDVTLLFQAFRRSTTSMNK